MFNITFVDKGILSAVSSLSFDSVMYNEVRGGQTAALGKVRRGQERGGRILGDTHSQFLTFVMKFPNSPYSFSSILILPEKSRLLPSHPSCAFFSPYSSWSEAFFLPLGIIILMYLYRLVLFLSSASSLPLPVILLPCSSFYNCLFSISH